MRDLINQIAQGYRSARVESQDTGALVVRAQEPESQRPVWIQIMRGVLSRDPQISARFRTLATAIRQLNHPNISAVREVGEKGGLPYIVVRALEKAQPLAAKLDQPWAVDAAADVVMQAGSALEHAYKKGVLHGSLSPDNLWVEENGRVQVTGFGARQILELLQVRLQTDSPFAAPERRAGGPADARADVYALAAILYSLLARRVPVVIQGNVLPPSRFNPDLPAEMDRVIVQGLAQEPAERYADVQAFVRALGSVPLVPVVQAVTAAPARRCPKCGTPNPSGRFCTKCGTTLEPAAAGQAVAAAQVAPAVAEEAPSPPAAPAVAVAAAAVTGAMDGLVARFPDPLPMPEIDLQGVWARLGEEIRLSMPQPLEMPALDWAEVTPSKPDLPPARQG